jgi:hypothetical protein
MNKFTQGDKIKFTVNGVVKVGEFHRYGASQEGAIIFVDGVMQFINEKMLEKHTEMKKIIHLKNLRTGETDIYHAPTHTKIDGVYGYLVVDVDLAVQFFSEHDGVEMETLDYIEASIINEGEVKFG